MSLPSQNAASPSSQGPIQTLDRPCLLRILKASTGALSIAVPTPKTAHHAPWPQGHYRGPGTAAATLALSLLLHTLPAGLCPPLQRALHAEATTSTQVASPVTVTETPTAPGLMAAQYRVPKFKFWTNK